MSEESNPAVDNASDRLGLVVAKDNDIQVNGTNIRLDLIEGFDELNDRQQRYLQRYAQDPENKTLACMELGYSTRELNRWFKKDDFSRVADTIYDIYTEVLKGIDFKEAIKNPNIRSRVIKSRERGGKYTEEQQGSQHIHFSGDSISDLAKLMDKSK